MKRLGLIDFRRLPFLLAAMLGLGLCPLVDSSNRPASWSNPAEAIVNLVPSAVGSSTSSSLASFARLSRWRHRLKSVPEDTDARGFQPVALGLFMMPEHADISVVSAP